MIPITPSSIAIQIGPIPVYWYGIAYAVGLAVTYIVMASGLGDLDTLRYASEFGVHMFLRKPFRAGDIEAAVDQAKARRANHDVH